MSDNKPPMTVWIGDGRNTPKRGPYVNLEKFLEKAGRMAAKVPAGNRTEWQAKRWRAVQDLAKQIMEEEA